MQDKGGVNPAVTQRIELVASQIARERARNARWDLDVAIFLFGIMILVIILLFQNVTPEIVSAIAVTGLVAVWVYGWWREKRMYGRFYKEELARLQSTGKTMEETIEERIQRAIRDRMH